MHISSCLNPKTITNPYTRKKMVVPCGHCSACLNNKSAEMVQRLDIESSMSKYVVFATLTFDSAHLPKLKVLDNCLYDTDYAHVAPGRPRISFNIEDTNPKSKDYKFLNKLSSSGVPYLNRYFAQKFMKRLRINTFRLHQKYQENEEKSLLRFFLCGEYGPKNYRPHYHLLLFFNSELTAAHISELLHSSWKFGFVDSSFVKNTASSYVAKYVNCYSNLPSFLQHREVRPFCLYSTCPPIGTMYFNDERIKEIFTSCSPFFMYGDSKKRQFVDVPLWRFLQDRIFPRCPLFSEISHFDRVTLYRAATNYPFTSGQEFVDWCKEEGSKSDQLQSLLSRVSYGFTIESSLFRLYYISHLVWSNSLFFDVDISTYVEHIERYYENVDFINLKRWYEWQEDEVNNKGTCLSDFVWFDKLWFDMVLTFDDFEDDVPYEIRFQLQSYGIDEDEFFSADLTSRKKYRDSLALSNVHDFKDYQVNQEKIMKDNFKTKKKNDYLQNDGVCLSDVYNEL